MMVVWALSEVFERGVCARCLCERWCYRMVVWALLRGV